jgi:hypothetical protein
MEKIFHNFDVKTSASKIYEELVTVKGLQNWWTNGTSGNADKGGELKFSFGSNYVKTMKVTKTEKNKTVQWKCVHGPKDWIGTTLTFKLKQSKGITNVRFVHDKWKKANDFYGHCNYHWGLFMKSLKTLAETGKGMPHKN